MAENFLDVIANKEFKVAKRDGYDANDVDSFLDEILAEMEKREDATAKLEAKVAELTQALKNASAAPAAAPKAAAQPVIDQISALPSSDDITLDDKAAVEAVRAAYDALTEGSKQYVQYYDYLLEMEAQARLITIIAIVAGVVVIAGGVTAFLLIRRKKKSKAEA